MLRLKFTGFKSTLGIKLYLKSTRIASIKDFFLGRFALKIKYLKYKFRDQFLINENTINRVNK